jgi:hypothetical protein
VISGCVVAESLRAGVVWEPAELRIRRITRLDVSSGAAAGQPAVWTVIDFEAPERDADALAAALAACLAAEGGWYADFRTDDDRVVVFAGKVFRYRHGDDAGRAEAVAYGRSVGVPEHQLDWPA